jgi:hypothetical protein
MELSPEAFTVVVGADDEDGLFTRDLAVRWHEDGLLGEFAWVTPADVADEPYGPPTVCATVPGLAEPVELMTYLGMRPRMLIRLVLVQLLTHEHADPTRLVGVSDRIADLVNRALPRRVLNEGGTKGTRLLRVNLLVPESDLQPQGRELVLPKWEVNAIVSPQRDRLARGPSRPRSDERVRPPVVEPARPRAGGCCVRGRPLGRLGSGGLRPARGGVDVRRR